MRRIMVMMMKKRSKYHSRVFISVQRRKRRPGAGNIKR
jgi:hypothetical protein